MKCTIWHCRRDEWVDGECVCARCACTLQAFNQHKLTGESSSRWPRHSISLESVKSGNSHRQWCRVVFLETFNTEVWNTQEIPHGQINDARNNKQYINLNLSINRFSERKQCFDIAFRMYITHNRSIYKLRRDRSTLLRMWWNKLQIYLLTKRMVGGTIPDEWFHRTSIAFAQLVGPRGLELSQIWLFQLKHWLRSEVAHAKCWLSKSRIFAIPWCNPWSC